MYKWKFIIVASLITLLAFPLVGQTNRSDIENCCPDFGDGINEGLEWEKHLIDREEFPAGPYKADPKLNSGRDTYNIVNTGGDNVEIKNIKFESIRGNGISAFKARLSNGNVMPLEEWFINVLSPQILTPNNPERKVEVLFHPTTIGEHEVNVHITTSQVSVENEITANFYGIGGVPRISVTPSIEFGEMFVDKEAEAETPRMITITNEPHEYDYELTFDSDPISFDNESIVRQDLNNWDGETFRFDLSVLESISRLQPGESIDIPVEFVARQEGLNEVNTTVHSNAEFSTAKNTSRWYGVGYDNFFSVEKAPESKDYLNIKNNTLHLSGNSLFEEFNKVTFYDLNGSVILDKNIKPSLTVDLNQFNSGVYFIVLSGSEKIITKKFEVVK